MSNLPFFKEIFFTEEQNLSLIQQIQNNQVGEIPTYWIINDTTSEKLIKEIENLLMDNNINYIHPYPMYIVTTNSNIINTKLPQVENLKQLPKYFNRPLGDMKNCNNTVIKRMNISQEKLRNIIQEHQNKYQSQIQLINKRSKVFFNLIKQNKYYENLQAGIKNE